MIERNPIEDVMCTCGHPKRKHVFRCVIHTCICLKFEPKQKRATK